MSDGQVVFEITADSKKAKQSIEQLSKDIASETKKWDSSVDQAADNIEQSMNRALDANRVKDWALKVGQALLEFGKEAIGIASDLQEVQNVVDVTFGSSAGQIQTWADNAGKQFGLTEIQAKRFASTLGAMMKSAGMAGPEIVQMSTDLSGLAADMASFYNLDFETAFQKIRSGLSGETEPLKQLGINMNVANLEAYALSQGITKAFDKMSQSEQIMLRYQYMMSATADAQGDFARTSDSYANSMRTWETNMDTLKAKMGKVFITGLTPVINNLNEIIGKITTKPEQTLFDQISAINLDMSAQLAEIQTVSDHAHNLIDTLALISGTDAGKAMEALASGANKLDTSAPGTWEALLGALQSVNGLSNIFGSGSTANKNVQDLAQALSGATVDADKAAAWQTLLGALSSNADAVSKLTGASVEETAKWLSGLAEAANSIDAGDAAAWDKLLTTLLSGFSSDTPEGQQFVQGLASQFLAMGQDSEVAANGLAALGYGTDEIASKQKEWLKYCNELVRTIPGLSEIINTETGAINGGVGALSDYVEEWKSSQEKLIYWKAYYAKKNALAETEANLYSLQIEAGGADIAAKKVKAEFDKAFSDVSEAQQNQWFADMAMDRPLSGRAKEWADSYLKVASASEKAKQAQEKYNTAQEQSKQVTEDLANEHQWLVENIGEVEEAEADAADAAGEFQGQSEDAWKTAVAGAHDAVKALSDYVQKVREATQKNVDKSVGGFESVESKSQEAIMKISALVEKQAKLNTETKKGREEYQKLQEQIDKLNGNVITPESMLSGLESQIAFMDQYLTNLEKAKNMGLSDALLSSLSDGSVESADYLAALVQDSTGDTAREIDKQYQEVQRKKDQLTNTLTDQQMAADSVYQNLAAKAAEAVAALDLGADAAENSGKTIQGVAEGIMANVPGVANAVSAVLSELNKLSGWGVNFNFGPLGSFGFSLGNIPQLAIGMDHVPFDGFLASLHEGEAVLTAEENRIWQRFKSGDASSRNVDYETLGGVMRDNVKAGGNVYLDSRVVGGVISDMQARSYKSLKRSGWQA